MAMVSTKVCRDMKTNNCPSALFREFADILVDPVTQESIDVSQRPFATTETGRQIPLVDGIPNLFVPSDFVEGNDIGDVTNMVKAFYEETPFPNYDDLDSRDSLVAKARRGIFATLLDEQLPDHALVLEAGCGTGQLSNFLGMSWRRKIFAGDMCLNSLRLAKGFADHYVIRNTAFLQMNIFHPPFRDGVFDVVISNGVLHHTGHCERAFETLVRKVKPKGYLLIGLYNQYGRLPTLWKRWGFDKLGSRLHFLDPRLRDWTRERQRTKAWFMDQYRHPHETRHSMDEVLGWFDRYGLEFVNGIPHLDGSIFGADDRLFELGNPGNRITRVATQLEMLFSGGRDGGLFIMIGRKR